MVSDFLNRQYVIVSGYQDGFFQKLVGTQILTIFELHYIPKISQKIFGLEKGMQTEVEVAYLTISTLFQNNNSSGLSFLRRYMIT